MNTKAIAMYATVSVLVFFSLFSSAIAVVGGTPAYQVESVPFQWIDATTGTAQNRQVTLPIGFNFRYYDQTFNTLAVMTEGYLAMGRFEYSDYTPRIMPYLDYSMDIGGPNSIYTKLEGASPNRQFTVAWIDLTHQGGVTCGDQFDSLCDYIYFGKVSFQVTLYEGSNDIVFRYLDVVASDEGGANFTNRDNGRTATVLVEKGSRTEGTLYSRNQAAIQNGTALRFFMGTPSNLSPVANGGTVLFFPGPPVVQIVKEGAMVTLNGTGSSDYEGAIASYSWTQAYSQTIPLINANTATTSFVAPPGDNAYYFDLTVTDNQRAHSIDRVAVYVQKVPPPNVPPVAQAGPDQTVKQKTTVTLNGLGSSDPDGNIVSYRWHQIAGKTVTLKNTTSAQATFTAPSTDNPINLTFELTVTDNSGATATDQVVVTVVKR